MRRRRRGPRGQTSAPSATSSAGALIGLQEPDGRERRPAGKCFFAGRDVPDGGRQPTCGASRAVYRNIPRENAMRLLIVEDNAELSRLVAGGLSAAGYESDIVGSAAEAREAVSSVSYAAMILDLGLPD